MVRLEAFRCDYFTLHGQLLGLTDVDVNGSYFELAQIYLLRSERHGPMYIDSPLFGANPPNPPSRFRSAAINPLLSHQCLASDHLAAKSRAVVRVQLKNRVPLGFVKANAELKEAGEPFQYYQSLLIA